jgi:hypothetical protein
MTDSEFIAINGWWIMSKRYNGHQKVFVQKIERSVEKLNPLISEARMLRLFILERELQSIQDRLRYGMDMQRRAFSDDSLTSNTPLLVTGLDQSR